MLARGGAGRPGWLAHALKLVQNGQWWPKHPTLEAQPGLGERHKLRAGESFTVNIKGVGWTELDNGFAMTYDNAYAGYACGFNSNGDVTLELVATGGPGTSHRSLPHGVRRQRREVVVLDASAHVCPRLPALSLGYRLPAFRLAIAIVD